MMNVFEIFVISATCLVYPSYSIIGGKEIRISEAPFQVGLESNGVFFCGGVILDKTTILTTVMCTEKENVVVRAGSSLSHEGGFVSKVKQAFPHELFNNNSRDYDISILKLETPLVFDTKIQPINLINQDFQIDVGMKVIATGWGTTEIGAEEVSTILRKVELKIVDKTICTASNFHPITERMICAADTDKDACIGDAGGPLVANKTLIGLISFGVDCAHPLHPGVYVNIKEFLPWIKTKLEMNLEDENNVNVNVSQSGIGVMKLIFIVIMVVLIVAISLVFLIRRSYKRRLQARGERLIMENYD